MAVISYMQKYVYTVLVNFNLSLPRKSVVRLTDSFSMTIAGDWNVKPQTKQKSVNVGIGVAPITAVYALA